MPAFHKFRYANRRPLDEGDQINSNLLRCVCRLLGTCATSQERGSNAHSAANEWVAALARRLRDVET